MKQTKESLLKENEELSARILYLENAAKEQEEINRDRREILSTILGSSAQVSYRAFPLEKKAARLTWLEIACEIGKLIERSCRFESIERMEKMGKLVGDLRLSNEEIFKRLNKNENRN